MVKASMNGFALGTRRADIFIIPRYTVSVSRFDALLVVSFGGPEKHEDVIPVYWGNRNWHPLLADTVRQMRDDGIRRAIAFTTSAFGSYSGCRQYGENIQRARAEVGEGAPELARIRPFSSHPLFIEAMADRVSAALAELPRACLVFTAHSVPVSMAESSPYVQELEAASRKVAAAVGVTNWKLVYQSRSGPPTQPWLGPDICDDLREFHCDTVIAPIGFLSDHMEVVYDLDTEAR